MRLSIYKMDSCKLFVFLSKEHLVALWLLPLFNNAQTMYKCD
ncbi:hypothetical protein VCHA34P126_80089 [Vibrio chagasii]|nr:hypothetical protein VCHA28FP16_130077 [Vibrio chagasii]CAH6944417.1 hypothetical protein VCHA52P454_130077 [Vibrio chagasii]CAH7001613.1 hypothetical protein VCHA50O393_160077 [Vibrio chagasii]CAH7007332.1 hypothetical protein VCHA53O473_130063 [Vibrio chagasii]CAH7083168.1 hypothetical protein VCHA34P126_80089 [Vibrio chagasii]